MYKDPENAGNALRPKALYDIKSDFQIDFPARICQL